MLSCGQSHGYSGFRMFSPRLLAIAVLVLATGSSRAADDPVTSKKVLQLLTLRTWKVSKVQPAAVGNGGSILVVRFMEDGFSTQAMWLGIGSDTKFTINGRAEGARVSDVTEGMDVTFDFGGLTKMLPPQAVGLTSVNVSGQVGFDPEVFRHKAIRRAWKELKYGAPKKN